MEHNPMTDEEFIAWMHGEDRPKWDDISVADRFRRMGCTVVVHDDGSMFVIPPENLAVTRHQDRIRDIRNGVWECPPDHNHQEAT